MDQAQPAKPKRPVEEILLGLIEHFVMQTGRHPTAVALLDELGAAMAPAPAPAAPPAKVE